MKHNFQQREQELLLFSTLAMALVAAAGLSLGLASGSRAILTDGVFSAVAVVIKLLMLGTSRLIARETSVRFQFGYWQMEPLVLVAEGALTLLVVGVAAAAGLEGLLSGGRAMDFGLAVWFGLFFAAVSVSFYCYLKRENRALRSHLVHFDSVSWYVDTMLAGGLLLSFGAAWALEQTAYAAWSRYADPLVMLALSLHMIRPALRILCPSFRQILGVAPADVHERVQQVMDEAMERHGFADYVSSVQQYGRARIIEIDILFRRDEPAKTAAELDALRGDIADALGYAPRDLWLTINFTGDRRWMARDYLLDA